MTIEGLRKGSPTCRSLRPTRSRVKKLAVDDLTANVVRATINLYTRGAESVKGSTKPQKNVVTIIYR